MRLDGPGRDGGAYRAASRTYGNDAFTLDKRRRDRVCWQ